MSAPAYESEFSPARLARAWAEVASQSTYLAMSGEETEQLLTRLVTRLVAAATATPVDEQAAMEVAAELVEHDLTGPRSIGRSIEVLAHGLPRLTEIRDVDRRYGAVLRVLAALSDGYADALRRRTLDEQELIAQALLRAKLEAETRFREVFLESTVGIAISTLDGIVVNANNAFAEMAGRTPSDLIGAPLRELLQAEDDSRLAEAYRKLTDGQLPRFRHRRQFTAATGEVAWTHLGGSLLHDADGLPSHHLTIVENITELHLLQQELSKQALHDVLTGLPNEHYLMSRLQEVLERTNPSAPVTLCRVNLDNFSVINEGLGRAAGEALLCSIANRLTELVKEHPAMVARLGGDDFAVLIEDSPRSPEPGAFASSINEAISEPVYFEGRGLAVSASVGIVRRRAGETSPAELIRSANTTLLRAKRTGGGQWSFDDPQADALDQAIYRMAAEMPGAFENGEITLRYQPVHRLDNGRIVAIQALLRWERTDDDTVVKHPTCLALAEQSGLLGPLGRWMVHEACRTQGQMLQDPACVATLLRVDLTTHLSQDPDLIAVVRRALSSTGLRAEQVWIGVPLVALVHGRGDVIDNVGVLAELGVKVVMLCNAAGPEYLAYLEDLPLSAVEISPDIVTRIAARPGENSVVAQALRRSIPLVHSTGTTVIVPGIDTPEQAQWWRDAGADSARGAHFGPPVRDSELANLLTPTSLSRDLPDL
ncbi:MAG: EAL domain-containing protein [Actinomycetota bacterium]|nr:EAL domain-containing protein [Actinomycetota bacterium]